MMRSSRRHPSNLGLGARCLQGIPASPAQPADELHCRRVARRPVGQLHRHLVGVNGQDEQGLVTLKDDAGVVVVPPAETGLFRGAEKTATNKATPGYLCTRLFSRSRTSTLEAGEVP